VAAIRHARAAIANASDDATVLAIAGFIVALNERDDATGFTMFDRAIAASGCNIFALSCSALILAFRGQPKAAIERAERALRVSPLDPLHYLAYNALAVSCLALGRYEESRDAARLSVQLNPQFAACHLFLTAALVRLGDEVEAKQAAQRALALDPAFSIRRLSGRMGFGPLVLEPLADAWRRVGLPEG
jgi:tetratricopeptide (TPR) repeat protein